MLKFLRTKRLNLEEFDQCELDKIKDLFEYLQIAMPISLPSVQWDASKCRGSMSVQNNGSEIFAAPQFSFGDRGMVLGTDSVSQFRVELGEGQPGFTDTYIGFISSEDFVNDRSVVEKGWSMAFTHKQNGSIFDPQPKSCVRHPFVANCTLTALHLEDRHEITFKLKSKEGRQLLECSFQGIPAKKLHPFVFCDGTNGRQYSRGILVLKSL